MQRRFAALAADESPRNATPAYRSSIKRAPTQAAISIPHTWSETSGPRCGAQRLSTCANADLTRSADGGVAQGQRIHVYGRVSDDYGRAERGALIEIWQANAAGRYRHPGDNHDAPLDPYFSGAGAVLTDDQGNYSFVTIAPGAYPWSNHANAWRPQHIHFSLFGPAWATRLITQMYFPGDPTLPFDPIFMSIAAAQARARLVAQFDLAASTPDYALAYRFDIVLRGPRATPREVAP